MPSLRRSLARRSFYLGPEDSDGSDSSDSSDSSSSSSGSSTLVPTETVWATFDVPQPPATAMIALDRDIIGVDEPRPWFLPRNGVYRVDRGRSRVPGDDWPRDRFVAVRRIPPLLAVQRPRRRRSYLAMEYLQCHGFAVHRHQPEDEDEGEPALDLLQDPMALTSFEWTAEDPDTASSGSGRIRYLCYHGSPTPVHTDLKWVGRKASQMLEEYLSVWDRLDLQWPPHEFTFRLKLSDVVRIDDTRTVEPLLSQWFGFTVRQLQFFVDGVLMRRE
ncbi:hypothetical protein F5Y10DRAFT_267935 [Nemania abortiva]|nr:hypothetical protein F5Y10DRAFT_267935 [Nemania abortiva]